MCPGAGSEGWLKWFAHPLGDVICRGACEVAPPLLQAILKWQLWVLVSVTLVSIICPSCACLHLFLVPHSFFIFCSSRRGVSRCKQGLQQRVQDFSLSCIQIPGPKVPPFPPLLETGLWGHLSALPQPVHQGCREYGDHLANNPSPDPSFPLGIFFKL